jgi:hypothetical protein
MAYAGQEEGLLL